MSTHVTSEVVRLDRTAPVPLYYQLRQLLLNEIRKQGLQPGDQLPTELDIEKRYQVSRSTIRQAINDLVADGLVERVQGKGTFVAAPKIRHIPRLTSFKENMLLQGYVPSHRTLASYVTGAPEETATKLEIREEAPCRFLRRLLLADGKVIGVAETWLPEEILGEHSLLLAQPGFNEGSLYDLLENPPVSIVLEHGVERIGARVADSNYADLLGCKEGDPLLTVDRVTHDSDERAVEWTHMVFLGTKYEYPVKMNRPNLAERGE